MSTIERRGRCPTLSAPMQTGDGLLVRLSPLDREIAPSALALLATAAQRHGNGELEITARGNLQIRGLREQSLAAFTAAVEALPIATSEGIPVEVGALSGHDATERADPRPLAAAIRRAIRARTFTVSLSAKISILVDGGGRLGLGALDADIRLVARDASTWQIAVGGSAATARSLGVVTADEACDKILSILAALAAAGPHTRARDLYPAPDTAAQPMSRPAERPVGLFRLQNGKLARGFGWRFGRIEAPALIAFAASAAAEDATIHLAPGRGSLVIGLDTAGSERLAETAARHGMVVSADDPSWSIAACRGAPGCASARLSTLPLAAALARDAASLFDGSITVHLSGCAKGCAHPAVADMTLVGGDLSCDVVFDATARSPAAGSIDAIDRDSPASGFARLAAARCVGQTTKTSLAALGPVRILSLLRGDGHV